MRKKVIIIVFVSLGSFNSSLLYGFDNLFTHPAITGAAIDQSVLNQGFLQSELSLSAGMAEQSELTDDYENQLDTRVAMESNLANRPSKWRKNQAQSLKDWLIDGSMYEDTPNPRARHHFYDPIRNSGQDNYAVTPFWVFELANSYTSAAYPDYYPFIFTGNSSLNQGLGKDALWPEPIGLNTCIWLNARFFYEQAIVGELSADRKKNLATSFLILGHICHLLQDTGVPAHTRNDFTWGHLVAGYPRIKAETGKDQGLKDGGNPFEAWVEIQVRNNNSSFPWPYYGSIVSFSKISDFWDKGICTQDGEAQWLGDNETPPLTWGLAEATNYQFLSYSTAFKDDGSNQVFPHPAKTKTREWSESDPYKKYYLGGYGVPRLARVTYSSTVGGIQLQKVFTEDRKIYSDYADITIPRTIDYTTGLINYFFRGRILAEQTAGDEITVTNISENSGIPQVFKGGTFELYWDDQDGIRSLITTLDFSNNVLAYNETIPIEFTPVTPPEGKYLDTFVVVYKGGIQSDADHPDTDDNQALATTSYCQEELMIMAGTPYASTCECGVNSEILCGDLRYAVDIWNFSEKSGSPQNLTDGIFKVYYKDMQGQLILLTSVAGSLDYTYYNGEELEPVLRIDLGVMEWTPAQSLIVVYEGKIVDSENPTEEYDGMERGSIEVEGIGPYLSCEEYW